MRTISPRMHDSKLLAVLAQIAFDPVQSHVGEVVRLDRAVEVAVDLLNLSEDLLRLRLLRRDGPGIRARRRRDAERRYAADERLRLSSPANGHQLGRSGTKGACRRGPVRTSSAPYQRLRTSATAFRAENYPFLSSVRTAQSHRFRRVQGLNNAKTFQFVSTHTRPGRC